jgi:histidinol-phosphate aminotransferase
MKSFEDYIVPWVRNVAPYSDKHMDFAWSHPEVIRMMSNENPIPPSESVIDAILDAARKGNLYPGSGEELRRRLGEAAGLGTDNVLLGNGSTDIINIVVNTFLAPGDEAIIPYPTFSMYEARVRVNGGVPVVVPIGPPPDFYWDIDGIIMAVNERTRLVFLCTPNNPTGNEIKESDLLRILDFGLPTFIDEAYFELEDEPRTFAYLVKEYPNAIVSRTMSKAYGLAGFRIGYALADAGLVSYLNRVRIPWNVSLLTLAAASAALDDRADQERKLENNRQGRSYLVEEINKIPGLQAFPSQGNFVLIDASTLSKPSEEIKDEIIARGIFIRPMSPHHMKEGYIRVTVGTPAQNRRFLEVLKEYMAETKSGESHKPKEHG